MSLVNAFSFSGRYRQGQDKGVNGERWGGALALSPHLFYVFELCEKE